MNATSCATCMQKLARVFFHMHTFNFYAHNLGTIRCLNRDIQIAVKTQRLVILTDLVILGHIWIEVVLACKATPFSNIAIQCQANPNRGFNRYSVHYGHRPRQAKTHGTYLRVGLCTKISSATAPHL